jgi:hypothetical protein
MLKLFLAGFLFAPPAVDINNFLPSFQTVLEDVRSSEFNSQSCVHYLKTLEDRILQIDVRNISKPIFEQDAQAIADTSWEIREALHRRLSEFDLPCVNQIQSNFRQFRFVEDYILERVYQVKDLYPEGYQFLDEELIPMKTAAPYYVFNRRAEDRALKNNVAFNPGDLLISRGLSFLSAMIARLGSRGTQFSHVVMIAEDGPVTDSKKKEFAHTPRTLESYVGSGVAFFELDEALRNENARILWLRSKDQVLAAKASKLMGDRVSALSASDDKIYYDYDLDFKDHETMSCAEVAQTAYEEASNGAVHIPMYENEIKGAESLLKHIGLPSGKTFEPGDMEIDPRFELMGEFKDLRLTRDSRHKDVILSKIFEWMDTRGYQLHDSMTSKLAGGLIWKLRRTFLWPLVKKILKKDFSDEVPAKMLRTVTLLEQIGTEMLKEIRQKDLEFQKRTGWPMTYQELYQVMEDFRTKDEALYNSGKRKVRKQAKFHKYFRAG